MPSVIHESQRFSIDIITDDNFTPERNMVSHTSKHERSGQVFKLFHGNYHLNQCMKKRLEIAALSKSSDAKIATICRYSPTMQVTKQQFEFERKMKKQKLRWKEQISRLQQH